MAFDKQCGCMDETACNFDITAKVDDKSCQTLDCLGVCGGTAAKDLCGVCNGANLCLGCINPVMCNYNASKTIDD